ncbi:MAG: trypsin-like peptidase domain-containing protein, partial [Deltaproteobacteria bacterium]|nr:trypsin-like peptidase domain-containing protein [Deltaproteobacteria bacterium]
RWIVTNHHVIDVPGCTLRIRFGSGTVLAARLLRSDPAHDLAVLEATGGRVPAPPLELADSDRVEVGQTVLAFGSPFGLEGTLTQGIVSARRDLPGMGGIARRLIQTDAPINPGNSGGPPVDLPGRVIGGNTSIMSRTGGNHGIGFAVPSNYVKGLLNDLRSNKKENTSPSPSPSEEAPPPPPPSLPQPPKTFSSASIGIQGQDFRGGGFVGVQILRVDPQSSAASAGLLGAEDPPPPLVTHLGVPWTGHIIVAVDGHPIEGLRDLDAHLAPKVPGETVELTITVGPGRLHWKRKVVLDGR